jgi:hypothetical protein
MVAYTTCAVRIRGRKLIAGHCDKEPARATYTGEGSDQNTALDAMMNNVG